MSRAASELAHLFRALIRIPVAASSPISVS
jgi:hypothetical protein